MSAPRIRDATTRDIAAIRALNDPAVPAVNVLAAEVWARFLSGEAIVRVIDADAGDHVAALLVALPRGRPYGSLNYAWFQARLPEFVYVDRIVVAPARARSGLGRALYADLFARVGAVRPVVCEVNLEPANPVSLAFHASLGFREIGVHRPDPGKRVVMLARRPDGAGEPSWVGPVDGCTIEAARADSAGEVAALVASLLRELGATTEPDAAFASGLIGSGRVHAILARRGDGTAAGVITLAESASIYASGRFGVIQELYVSPELRSRGLGARLLAAAQREAASRHWNRLEVGAPGAARFPRTVAFYVANGFSEIGPRLQRRMP